MKRKIDYAIFLSVLIGFSSCGSKESSIPSIELEPVKSIDRFGDQAFVSDDIKSIVSHNGDYYFLDRKSSVVIRTDGDLRFKTSYGRRGRGPGEAIFVESFGVGSDKVYLDGSLCNYNVFDLETGNCIQTIAYDDNIGHRPVSQRILVDDNSIIASYNGEYTINETPVVALDSSGHFIGAYRGNAEGDNPTTKANTDRDIFKTGEGKYLSLVKNSPTIDLYDGNLNHRGTIDLSEIGVVKSRMNQIERFRKKDDNPNTVHYLFKDSYYSDGFLYILCYSENTGASKNNPVQCNTVVKLALSEDDYIHLADFILPDPWYNTICVDPDGKVLIAANTLKSEIELFNLP